MKTIFLCLFSCLCLLAAAQTDTSRAVKDTLTGTAQNVTVTGKPQAVQHLLDKTVINVSANPLSAGSSVFEVLQKSPGISVTGQDALVMNGKQGLNVYVDGRPTQLSGQDLAAYLKSIQAESVDKIELITNPSAKYDAAGNAGIINIRLKKNKALGTNGTVNGSYTQNIHYRTNGGLSLNHRSRSVNLFGNYAINHSYQHVQVLNTRRVPLAAGGQSFLTRSVEMEHYTSQNMRIGADVTLSKKWIAGVLYTRNQISDRNTAPGTTTIGDTKTDSLLQTLTGYRMQSLRQNVNGNLRYEDTSGNTLNIDADYIWFGGHHLNPAENRLYNAAGQLLTSRNTENGLVERIHLYSLKADYNHPIKQWNGTLEAGAKVSLARTTNNFTAQNQQSGAWKTDTSLSNRFRYHEDILAAYGAWQGSHNRWQYKAGLRAEHSRIKGISTPLKGSAIYQPDTTYFNLFPTAYVSYQWKGGAQQVKLAYSRRIGRPAYQDLIPFQKLIDQYTIEAGNPYLKPAFTHNLEASFVYQYAMSATLGYSRTTKVSETNTYLQGSTWYSLRQNVGTQNNVYLSLSIPYSPTKWWETYTNATVFYNHYRAQLSQGLLSAGGPGLNLYNQQTFVAGKGWQFTTEYWGTVPGRQGIYQGKYLGSLGLGIQKKILHDRGTLRLNYYDVFRTQRWAQTVAYGNVQGSIDRRWEAQGIRLSFSLKFGGSGVKESRQRNSESGERIREKSGD